ncbi:MAG: 30S ribosomal protein S9 [Elusimicrobia bacterium]|nr:30S ribosomal protein S9 [Elusimicrobiota bacterium]
METTNPKTTTNDTLLTVGKRKTSIAKVWLTPKGEGQFMINGKTMEGYFQNHPWQKASAVKPLVVAKMDKADVQARVVGGGVTGQADAIRLGIARAIAKIDPKLRKLMRDQGLLTRDSRIVERKKPGQPKARKRFQFSKR